MIYFFPVASSPCQGGFLHLPPVTCPQLPADLTGSWWKTYPQRGQAFRPVGCTQAAALQGCVNIQAQESLLSPPSSHSKSLFLTPHLRGPTRSPWPMAVPTRCHHDKLCLHFLG